MYLTRILKKRRKTMATCSKEDCEKKFEKSSKWHKICDECANEAHRKGHIKRMETLRKKKEQKNG